LPNSWSCPSKRVENNTQFPLSETLSRHAKVIYVLWQVVDLAMNLALFIIMDSLGDLDKLVQLQVVNRSAAGPSLRWLSCNIGWRVHGTQTKKYWCVFREEYIIHE